MKAPHLKHIFLTGFMGAGKSRVGKLLAGLLRRPLREMDQELARRFNMPIAQVFAQRGESVFRAAESKWLQKIMQEPKPCIISTGGGAVVSAVSRRLMDAGGGRVFIDVPLAVLEQRMNREESELRPLWRSRAERAQLWQNRYPLYNSAALSVNGAQAAEAVAREIAGYFMPVMEAEIKAMGRACRLRTVSWEIIGQAAAAVSSGRNFMLLDAALQDEAGHWREHGFQVQVMRRRGEALKTWPSACGVLRALQQQALARDDFMLVRGGGSLSDMGGFCAGIYKRGINLVLIATTLLAAADAAVGGKTALNFGPYKNQIGHFYLPRQVFMDVASFAGLRRGQLADGLIEAYKTGLIADAQLSGIIEDNLDIMLKGDLAALAWVAGRCMQIKASLVEQDFREEHGLRDLLNLGHTFGHVVESLSGYKISHGRAVSAGLAAAIKLSRQKSQLSASDAARMLETIARIWAPPPLPPASLAQAAMRQDKKFRSGALGFITLRQAGAARLERGLSMEEVIQAAYNEFTA